MFELQSCHFVEIDQLFLIPLLEVDCSVKYMVRIFLYFFLRCLHNIMYVEQRLIIVYNYYCTHSFLSRVFCVSDKSASIRNSPRIRYQKLLVRRALIPKCLTEYQQLSTIFRAVTLRRLENWKFIEIHTHVRRIYFYFERRKFLLRPI